MKRAESDACVVPNVRGPFIRQVIDGDKWFINQKGRSYSERDEWPVKVDDPNVSRSGEKKRGRWRWCPYPWLSHVLHPARTK